jgi:hypothetical protein
MSKPSLAELIRESARNVEAERAHNAKVARITEDVKARLAKRAETPKPMSCPRCGEPLPESWRTDPATSGTDNEDDVNVGDGAEVPNYDNRKLTPLQRALKSKGIGPFAED